MLAYYTTFELSLQRVETSQARASLLGSLGQLPRPQSLFRFRRTPRPLLETIEIRHHLSRGAADSYKCS